MHGTTCTVYVHEYNLKQQLQVLYSFTAVSFVKEFSLQDIMAARKEKLYYSQWQLMGEFCEDDSEDNSHDRSCSCLVSDSIGKFEKKFQEALAMMFFLCKSLTAVSFVMEGTYLYTLYRN